MIDRVFRFSLISFILSSAPAHAAADATKPPPFHGDVPIMVEEGGQSGISQIYTGPWEFFVGGGVAAFDCNNDNIPDLAIAGGTNPVRLYKNISKTGGALKFSEQSFSLAPNLLKKVSGIYPINLNNDDHQDLVLLRVGENILLKGGPNCAFENANIEFAFDGGNAWTTAFAATFETGAKLPTLAFGNYVDREAKGSPWGTCHDNRLFRPINVNANVNKTKYDKPVALSPGYCSLSMLFTDWNNSGKRALRITNDRQYYRGGEEQLWNFSEPASPTLYSRSEGWKKLKIWGMGIAQADIDGDGIPEFALTSMGDTKLQTLDAEGAPDTPQYRDVAYEKGATAHRPYTGDDLKPSTGWHSEFADFNNDGQLDLFIAKGNVERMPDFTAFDPDNLLLGKHDGSYFEAGKLSGIALNTRGRGGVITDLNMDGMLDLVVVNRKAKASIFRNSGRKSDGPNKIMGNWLQLKLLQDGANQNALDAKISVKTGNYTQTRTIQIGGGHASGKSGFIHIGLGVAERASIRITWPDGQTSAPYRVFANNFLVINRGDKEAQYWYPPE